MTALDSGATDTPRLSDTVSALDCIATFFNCWLNLFTEKHKRRWLLESKQDNGSTKIRWPKRPGKNHHVSNQTVNHQVHPQKESEFICYFIQTDHIAGEN